MTNFIAVTLKLEYFILILFLSCVLLLCYYDVANLAYRSTLSSTIYDDKYLISSSKCKIPNVPPWNEDSEKFFEKYPYFQCSYEKPLSFVTLYKNKATLFIDKTRLSEGITCCYANVTRSSHQGSSENNIEYTNCKDFDGQVPIYKDPVIVKCVNKSDHSPNNVIYQNAHVIPYIDNTIQEKLDKFKNQKENDTYSVLFIAIDSVSRLSFIRALPKTHKFIEQEQWIPLKGYNKIGDNTYPNVMGILSGLNSTRSHSVCKPYISGQLDVCPMIWYDFRNLGYVTGYGEDQSYLGTFNYGKKGFSKPPTDYYYRTYILAAERLSTPIKDTSPYCTGPEPAGERVLNLAKDFAITFKDYSSFGVFWMNSFSHEDINLPTRMDDKIKELLETLTNEGVTSKSFVIFLSDHGMRFGNTRETSTGWLEERLPFIYVSIPEWFQQKYPKEYVNFKLNSNRLTSPFDLHMTLQHILTLSSRSYNMTSSEACTTCHSLFNEVDSERSCPDAGIEQHWCTCSGFTEVDADDAIKKRLSDFLLKKIQDKINSSYDPGIKRCLPYSVESVYGIKKSQSSLDDKTYVLFLVRTKPKAVFEATVYFKGDIYTSELFLSGEISRINRYGGHDKCIRDSSISKFCYCK